jgi:hypothetical protein
VAKQYTHGLSFNAQYAWQRAFDYNSGYATWDKAETRASDGSLRTQQFVVYGLYQLPFGRNQMWGSGVPRWEDEVIGGWQFSPVLNWSNGSAVRRWAWRGVRSFHSWQRALLSRGDKGEACTRI